MKKLFIILALIIFTFISCKNNHPIVELKTETLLIGISGTGYINKIIDLETETNYLSTDTLAPLLMCRADSVMLLPKSASYNNNIITIQFDSDFEAKIKVEEKPTHINFELISFSNLEKTELIVWGPIPTSIKKTIGETVGVTRNEKYAIGIQALNPKTLGGYPWTDNDCTPQFDIFEQEDYSDLSEANKRETLYRVEAAKPEKFGSTLQCYCRNRIKERNIENLGHKKYTAPVYNDNGIIGSRIALFGCPVDKTLETIGKIETEESLPHP